MSYEKIAAVVYAAGPPIVPAVPALISFYYTVDSLFNDASMRSMYQARNMKDNSGATMVDDYAITEDERNIHLSLLEDAVFDVFLNFLKYTKAISDAIKHNVDYTPVTQGAVAAKTSYVKIVDNVNYNDNYLNVIDKNLLKAVRFYTLRDWFDSQGKDAEAKGFDALYMLALRNVKNYAFQLKKANV